MFSITAHLIDYKIAKGNMRAMRESKKENSEGSRAEIPTELNLPLGLEFLQGYYLCLVPSAIFPSFYTINKLEFAF